MLTYTVKSGDSLSLIARRFYGDARKFDLIAIANSLRPPYGITPAQKLAIPDTSFAPTAPAPIPSSNAALNEKRLANVHPAVATRALTLVELAAQRGFHLMITQGYRTYAEQDALYAKGRTADPIGKKYIVTKAKGGQSYHNFGLAFDIVVLDSIGKADWDTTHPGWGEAATIGKSLGLEWGGDWTGFKDLPHFQLTHGLTLQKCQSLIANGLPAVWAQVA